jgi:hypothetical protein
MKFETDSQDDRSMRQRVLGELAILDKDVSGEDHIRAFYVVRTVDRKGYRTPVPTFDDEVAAQYGEPMTQITVVYEVPDDVNLGLQALVTNIKETEERQLREAKEAQLEDAKLRAAAAQAEIDQLTKELEKT